MTPEDNQVLTEDDISKISSFFELLARFDAEDKAKTERVIPSGSFVVESLTDGQSLRQGIR
jgi:hypothetical protein